MTSPGSERSVARVTDDDFVLLDRWRSGDTDAGDTLMRRHFDSLCNFFRSKFDSGVEDLVQDVLLRCVERREQFRGRRSSAAYSKFSRTVRFV